MTRSGTTVTDLIYAPEPVRSLRGTAQCFCSSSKATAVTPQLGSRYALWLLMRLLLTAFCASLVFATSAHAATVKFSIAAVEYGSHGATVDVGTMRLVDQDAADDVVSVQGDSGGLTVDDPAGLIAAAGCTGVSATQVRCPVTRELDGGVELDLVLGGGNDTYVPDQAISSVTASGGPGEDRLEGPVAPARTNVFYDGGPGEDVLSSGNAVTSILEGGAGADQLIASSRERRTDITYLGSPTGVDLDMRTGRGSRGDAAGDRVTGRVLTLLGSSHADHLRAPEDGSLIYGQGGDDVLTGGRGEDSLDGGTGNNVIRGGAGNDDLSASAGAFGRPDNLLDGGPGADAINASRGTDRIFGGPGRDRVHDVGPRDRVALTGGNLDRITCKAPRRKLPRPALIRVDQRDRVGPSCPVPIIRRR